MAEATPILAQFAAFPQNEVVEQKADKFDMSAAKIDPADSKSLVIALSEFEQKSSDATIKMALQKAKAQLKGKRGLRDISGLESLEGEAHHQRLIEHSPWKMILQNLLKNLKNPI